MVSVENDAKVEQQHKSEEDNGWRETQNETTMQLNTPELKDLSLQKNKFPIKIDFDAF